MSILNASAETRVAERRELEAAQDLLEQALAILDRINAPADLRARVHEVVASLAGR